MAKYIFVTGGVTSALGKGITAASLGRLLISRGLRTHVLKIDPYINVDPGTMSPLQHGEVFVTQDGAETDLDLGHYERLMDINVNKDSNLTTGRVYATVIARERRGDFLGATVQVIPHVTNEIKDRIRRVGEGADVVIAEVGGTVGDIESLPYLEAIRQMRTEIGRDSVMFIHVTLVPYLQASGELKTKPTQHSVKELRSIGIQPDVIVTRSERPLSREMRDKIALFCDVAPEAVIQNVDARSIYEVPLLLEKEGLGDLVVRRLGLEHVARPPDLREWEALVKRATEPTSEVTIALVGKYVALHDAYLSVAEALAHGGFAHRCKVNIQWVDSEDLEETAEAPDGATNGEARPDGGQAAGEARDEARLQPAGDVAEEAAHSAEGLDRVIAEQAFRLGPQRYLPVPEGPPRTRRVGSPEKTARMLAGVDGILVPGGFGHRGIEGKIAACRYAREHRIPYLGICLGMQIAVIEFARHVLGLADANSTEFDAETPDPVIDILPEQKGVTELGGTMRLGLYPAVLAPGTRTREAYGRDVIEERHRHRFEFNNDYLDAMTAAGMVISGISPDRRLVEIIELSDHPWFVGTQFHGEFTSRPNRPQPLYRDFVKAAMAYARARARLGERPRRPARGEARDEARDEAAVTAEARPGA